jgi:hypothetical protein
MKIDAIKKNAFYAMFGLRPVYNGWIVAAGGDFFVLPGSLPIGMKLRKTCFQPLHYGHF